MPDAPNQRPSADYAALADEAERGYCTEPMGGGHCFKPLDMDGICPRGHDNQDGNPGTPPAETKGASDV